MDGNNEYLTLEGVQVLWRNFAGVERQYNDAGSRNFNIVLEDETLVNELIAQGWEWKPVMEKDGTQYRWHLEVAINYKSNYPPRITKVSALGKTEMREDTLEMLDLLPIQYVDLTVNQYHWEFGGRSGVKAYLTNLFVVVDESPLDLKWAQFEDYGNL